ncbi:hypothetical protein [Neptunomonas sp. XY-337]|uniref:hypothetical protein n=1 Tax=Neptunomonas sp. XY-337 TaxID=2561897 RepID=UPI0010AA6846|nr:hypothetical protein [Neptunomonas sp. XY-337]
MLNNKKYYIEFGISMALYAAAIVYSTAFLADSPNTEWRIWLSLLPIPPAILATIAVIRAIRRLDELQQHIQMMSFAISFAIVGLTTFTYGFLEQVGFPHIPYVWIYPFMIATWGLATPIVVSIYK